MPIPSVTFNEVDELSDNTDRGDGMEAQGNKQTINDINNILHKRTQSKLLTT
jgi:hypothetical protein